MKNQYEKEKLSDLKRKKRRNKALRIALISLIMFLGSFFIGEIIVSGYKNIFCKFSVVNAKSYNNTKNQKIASTKVEEKNNNIQTEVTKNKAKSNKINISNIYNSDGKKIAYLTFDDGPSPNVTPQVLRILKSYDIKATFFLVGMYAEQNSDLVKREVEEGHIVGNHTYSHNYRSVYSNNENFMLEVDKTNSILKRILGEQYNYKFFRFPGGSFETKKQTFKKCLSDKGYEYIDWNALNGDAEARNVSKEKLLARVKETTLGKEHIVVLMHDAATKITTAQALPSIIEYLKNQGYEFRTLN